MQGEIIGVCRFSFLGRGDWKSFTKQTNKSDDDIVASLRKSLFDVDRLNQRFQTFENITLRGLDTQTDDNFQFVALTSDELPKEYLSRLQVLSKKYKFLKIVQLPVMKTGFAVQEIYKKIGVDQKKILQFRLDDDDTVSRHYISRLRRAHSMLTREWGERPFAITFPKAMICGPVISKSGKPELKFMKRYIPHTGAGQAIYHTERNIFQWAHDQVGKYIVSYSDPSLWVMQTYFSENDTGPMTMDRIKKQKIEKISDDVLERALKEHFPFMDDDHIKWQNKIIMNNHSSYKN